MFYPIPNWIVFIWNSLSVISIDHNRWQVIYSIILMISCVYTIYITPRIVCTLETNCDTSLTAVLKGIYPRAVAITGLASRIIIILKGKHQLVKYKKCMDDFHIFTPITSLESNGLTVLSYRVVLCCILLTIPTCLIRLWILFYLEKNTIFFFILMYIQNFSMYCIETHFTVLCFVLYQKFVGINKDLMSFKINTIVRNKYPFVSPTGEKYGKINSTVIEYNKEVLNSLIAGYPMNNFMEKLKIKHKLVREAIKSLNNMFGIHLGLSICSLCLYAMFDLYYHMKGVWNSSSYKILIYFWILQYAVRFIIVTVLAHITTKEVSNFIWDKYHIKKSIRQGST